MIILAAAALSVTLGYNVQSHLPWTERIEYVNPAQFKNVLVAVTEQTDHMFIKYSHIGGSDDHQYKRVDGVWSYDTNEIKPKNLFILGFHHSFGNLDGFAGVGYLDHPDDIRLSGHTQFNLGFNYSFDNLTIGFEHYSNGRQIFGSSAPNIGIDFITVGYKF